MQTSSLADRPPATTLPVMLVPYNRPPATTLPVMLVPYDSTRHESFVFSSWLSSYRSSDAARNVNTDIYMGNHHRVIEDILTDPANILLMAVDSGDPDQYYGYACGTHRGPALVLHYTYVKQKFRRFGLARHLVESLMWRPESAVDLVFCTHLTHAGRGIIRTLKRWHYHPYLLAGNLL